jgi:hypothetical protein
LHRIARKLISHDRRRGAILARIRAAWRHLPPEGVLLFFDVKPMAVKAYGGRRYTREHRPGLERKQRTRGFCYLFLAYEATSGRRRWAFFDHKDSPAVCSFMRQVCRWYPGQTIWIVLDRDSPHPCKSRQTRREMRRLHLHWITLPAGSPDDNPVEPLFSDIHSTFAVTIEEPGSQNLP